jgi:hypothetical protein
MADYPDKLTMVPCRECAALRMNVKHFPGQFACSSYDIPELGLAHLRKAVAERIVTLWNAADG